MTEGLRRSVDTVCCADFTKMNQVRSSAVAGGSRGALLLPWSVADNGHECVCLSVSAMSQEPRVVTFSPHVIYGCGSVLLCGQRRDMSFISGFVNDVMFSFC